MTYYVYTHINKYDNKQYIGYTENLQDRWENNGIKYKTCPRFWSAICHYGWDAFSHIILYKSENREDALAKEKEYINYYNTTDLRYGYNLAEGGTGGNTHLGWSEQRKQQYSETCKKELQRRYALTNWKENLSKAQRKRWEKIKNGEMSSPCHPTGGEVHNAKKVKCIETGKIYACCADAVEELGYDRSKSSRISRVANGLRHTFCGFHWEFIDE